MRALVRVLLCALVLAGMPVAAHKASDGYLTIEHRGGMLDARLDLALRDLEAAIGLDSNGDGAIAWGELKRRHQAIDAYVLARLTIRSGGEACPLVPTRHEVDRHTDGAYAVVWLSGHCAAVSPVLAVHYRILFDTDATHRGLLRYVAPDGGTRSTVLSEDAPGASLSAATGWFEQAVAYLVQGVHHIWEGFDHLLFLLSLLLPAVLVRRDRRWEPVARFRDAFVDVAKVVTAFTIAHSITLTLAVMGWVDLPSRWVESAIALSVVVAAVNNLWPVLRNGRVGAAFAFGLIHGFGFAGALGELGLPDQALALSLASFNLGVELGQLAVVAIFLPFAFWFRSTLVYRRFALTAGSIVIAAIGTIWFVERAFDLPLAVLASAMG